MPQFTLLYGARQLLTLRGPSGARRGSDLKDLAVIENGSILIENGLIHSLGSTRRIENLKEAKSALTIDVSGSIIMPGLIDPDLSVTISGAGSGRDSRPSRIYDDGLSLMRSCLQQGTVTALVKACAEPSSFNSDIRLLRQFKKIGRNPVDTLRAWHIAQPPQEAGSSAAFAEALNTLSKRDLIDSISISSSAASEKQFGPYLECIRQSRLPTAVQWRGGPSDALSELLQQIRPRAVCCSSTLPQPEVEVLSASDSVGVFAPGSEVGRASGDALRRMADAGGAIALSSGYHPLHTLGFSMQMAISLATVHGGLSAEEAIVAATVNAAHAAGCGGTIGTIEKGKRANLLILNVSDYRQIPRRFGINHVGTVLKDGEVVLNRAGWKMGSNAATAGGMRSGHF